MIAQAVLRKLESTKLLIMTFSLFLCIVTRQQMEKVCRYNIVYVLQSFVVQVVLYYDPLNATGTHDRKEKFITRPNCI